ncbi:MFS transporter [Alkalihalobacillus deserti]|uniref:MFS transporter n=1 Tax=Alkalihalobacillus deserti TaxID=2879466 RepID=UPI001D14E9DC|nr:MFS transporter [Alkalihalobacillus deserti]
MKIFRIHKGWFILGITLLNLFACLGLGRFSLGAILPFMKESLSMSYTEVGIIASAVFLGYLIGAISVGYFVQRFTAKRAIILALIIVALGMGMSTVVFNFWSSYVSLLIIGLGSGAANVASLSIVGKWFSVKLRGMAMGIAQSGSGLGMVIGGFLVPSIMLVNNDGWRISWGVLSIIVLLIIFINVIFLEDNPEELHLKPVGTKGKLKEEIKKNEKKENGLLIDHVYKDKTIILIGLIYLTWGFSYIIFSTFLVDYLIIDTSIDSTKAGKYYAAAGIASIVSGFIWGILSDRIGRMLTLFIVYFFQSSLLLLLGLTKQPLLLLVVIILYALSLWAVPTVIVAAVSDRTTAHKASMAIGFITLFFGIGQWISPMIIGALLDAYGSYKAAFFVSAFICYFGSLGCIVMHVKSKNKLRKVEKSPA